MSYVVHRHNRWYAVSYQGQDPLTGRERRRWHRADDEASARTLAETLISSRYPRDPAHGVTVARFLRADWLPRRTRRLQPTTGHRYDQMAELYVIPRIGRVPLRRLTTGHLQRLYDQLLTDGRRDGTALAPKTVLNVHQLLRAALGDAERQGLVGANVARILGPPCRGVAPEQTCWNETQLRAFLDVAMRHRLGVAMWLAATTGMRRGEILGLRWDDIDFDAARLSVRRSVTCTGYRTHTTATKTPTSRRCIDLDDRTVRVLSAWRRRQTDELTAARPPTRVFTRPDGQPVHPHVFSQTFERLRNAADVPPIRLHDLRHTHATLLLKAGVPLKVVSERLGHSTPAFTMATYQHVLPGMQAEAAATFARLITIGRPTPLTPPARP